MLLCSLFIERPS